MTTKHETPRIYVACLAAYNNGKLHGEWIDATDADEIHEEIQEMLKHSPEPDAEEWAIHDYDEFCGLRLGEFADIEKVAELGALIEEHGPAFGAYAGWVGNDFATAEGFQDAYCGEYESEKEYAEEAFDDLIGVQVPEAIEPYIDFELFANTLFMDSHYSVAHGYKVFVFWRQ